MLVQAPFVIIHFKNAKKIDGNKNDDSENTSHVQVENKEPKKKL